MDRDFRWYNERKGGNNIQSTENRYKYIFDEILTLTDDGFVVVDTNGVITDINDQYCKYLKTTKEIMYHRSQHRGNHPQYQND